MNRHYNLVLLTFITFIIISSSTFLVFSQTTDPSTYNGSYKVKYGDSNKYNYTKVFQQGKNYETLALSNNSYPYTFIPYNLTKDVSVLVWVGEININSQNNTQIYINEQYSNPFGETCITFQQFNNGFIFPGFDSFTHAKTYYNSIYPDNNDTFSKTNDLISFSYTINSTSNYISNNIVINWMTSWIKKEDSKLFYSNGTLFSETGYQSISNTTNINFGTNPSTNFSTNSVTNSITTFSTNSISSSITSIYFIEFIVLGTILLIIAIPVLLAFSFKRSSSATGKNPSSQSFSQYLQKCFHFTNKNTREKAGPSAKKALEIIESILDESESNAK